jgi:acyl-CoA thioesterase-2
MSDGTPPFVDDLPSVLDLERLDRDLFRGVHAVIAKARHNLYGGQVAGQALVAAGRTVDDERLPHSFHGYFLRPGRSDQPVVFAVDRDRDGKSFSARHVNAIQEGEVIFSMVASFHREDTDAELDDTPARDVPPPEECAVGVIDPLLDMREVTVSRIVPEQVELSDCMWMRPKHRLPDDPLVHAAALAYMSDHGTGFGQMLHRGVGTGGPSIDHACWFHAPIDANDWVLLHMWPIKALGARGVYQGAMRDAGGRLGAILTQEQLLFPPWRKRSD